MTSPSIAQCDHCKGPAHWTIDSRGDVWYICKSQCDAFMQMDIWPEEPSIDEGVHNRMRGDEPYVTTEEDNALPF